MRKRQKLVTTVLLLTAAMAGINQAPLELKYVFYVTLAGVNWVLAAWSLKEGLAGIEWLTVLAPPVLFTLSVGLFTILLPPGWLLRVGVLALFAVGQYALLLSANIFSVAAIRTIALFRAAMAVGFAATILTGFLLYDTILSFRLPFWGNLLAVTISSVFLLIPALWTVKLEDKLSRGVWEYGLLLAFLMGGLAMAMSFWPVTTAVGGLFLSTALYVFLGIAQHHMQQRLYVRTVWEYGIVGLVVLLTMLLTAGYGN